MPIKFKAKSKEEIPAELQPLYVEREGVFMLDVEGAVDNARVEEVRACNVALSYQLAEQKKRFEAIESDQVKAITRKRIVSRIEIVTQWCPNFRFDPPKEAVPNPSQVF